MDEFERYLKAYCNGEENAVKSPVLESVFNCKGSEIRKMVKGFMIESYIEEGCQKIGDHIYGKSITDPCLGWEKSERLLLELADKL